MRYYRIKIKAFALLMIALAGIKTTLAQQSELSIMQAIQLAMDTSYDAKIAEIQVSVAEDEVQVAKNKQYPDFKITGQYDYLTNPIIDNKLHSNNPDDGSQPAAPPEVHNLYFGQASLALPIFAGGKIKNNVRRSQNLLQSALYQSKSDKEKLALRVVQAYVNLYNARQTIDLMEDNLKSANQRLKDFTGMEENGLLARNDLLKAQLQASNIELRLAEAQKTGRILKYQVTTLLNIPKDAPIRLKGDDFGSIEKTDSTNAQNRNDIEALRYQREAALNRVKIAKGQYYPSISLMAGYVALNIENVARIENAMNFGVGLSYNLADIFKAKSEVHAAEGRALTVTYNLEKAKDQADIQTENAREEYKLAIKKFNVYTLSQEQAIENYRIVNNKYKNGLADTNDLLEADTQQLRARVNLATAGANITEKYYELLAAEGQLLAHISK